MIASARAEIKKKTDIEKLVSFPFSSIGPFKY